MLLGSELANWQLSCSLIPWLRALSRANSENDPGFSAELGAALIMLTRAQQDTLVGLLEFGTCANDFLT